MFAKNPGLTLIAVFSLSLAIGPIDTDFCTLRPEAAGKKALELHLRSLTWMTPILSRSRAEADRASFEANLRTPTAKA
jgi:hypothetical protein